MSFNITDSLSNSVIQKPIKILVEESTEEPVEDSKIDVTESDINSNEDIFQKTRDNSFKPGNGVKIIPFMKTPATVVEAVNHITIPKNLATKEDTLNTLLRMKGIIARK
jgi:hypothetical protein